MAGALLSASFAGAQQRAAAQTSFSYDVRRETTVQGTVLSYTAASTVAPIGPHAIIQTASGTVDVHLGNAAAMKQNDFFLAPGDSVKLVGESQTFTSGTVFLARLATKGSQTVALRNMNGIPMVAKAASTKTRSILGGAR